MNLHWSQIVALCSEETTCARKQNGETVKTKYLDVKPVRGKQGQSAASVEDAPTTSSNARAEGLVPPLADSGTWRARRVTVRSRQTQAIGQVWSHGLNELPCRCACPNQSHPPKQKWQLVPEGDPAMCKPRRLQLHLLTRESLLSQFPRPSLEKHGTL